MNNLCRLYQCFFMIQANEYQGKIDVYAIKNGQLLSDNLPPKKHKLVVAWIEIHNDDLNADWELAIRGLDQ